MAAFIDDELLDTPGPSPEPAGTSPAGDHASAGSSPSECFLHVLKEMEGDTLTWLEFLPQVIHNRLELQRALTAYPRSNVIQAFLPASISMSADGLTFILEVERFSGTSRQLIPLKDVTFVGNELPAGFGDEEATGELKRSRITITSRNKRQCVIYVASQKAHLAWWRFMNGVATGRNDASPPQLLGTGSPRRRSPGSGSRGRAILSDDGQFVIPASFAEAHRPGVGSSLIHRTAKEEAAEAAALAAEEAAEEERRANRVAATEKLRDLESLVPVHSSGTKPASPLQKKSPTKLRRKVQDGTASEGTSLGANPFDQLSFASVAGARNVAGLTGNTTDDPVSKMGVGSAADAPFDAKFDSNLIQADSAAFENSDEQLLLPSMPDRDAIDAPPLPPIADFDTARLPPQGHLEWRYGKLLDFVGEEGDKRVNELLPDLAPPKPAAELLIVPKTPEWLRQKRTDPNAPLIPPTDAFFNQSPGGDGADPNDEQQSQAAASESVHDVVSNATADVAAAGGSEGDKDVDEAASSASRRAVITQLDSLQAEQPEIEDAEKDTDDAAKLQTAENQKKSDEEPSSDDKVGSSLAPPEGTDEGEQVGDKGHSEKGSEAAEPAPKEQPGEEDEDPSTSPPIPAGAATPPPPQPEEQEPPAWELPLEWELLRKLKELERPGVWSEVGQAAPIDQEEDEGSPAIMALLEAGSGGEPAIPMSKFSMMRSDGKIKTSREVLSGGNDTSSGTAAEAELRALAPMWESFIPWVAMDHSARSEAKMLLVWELSRLRPAEQDSFLPHTPLPPSTQLDDVRGVWTRAYDDSRKEVRDTLTTLRSRLHLPRVKRDWHSFAAAAQEKRIEAANKIVSSRAPSVMPRSEAPTPHPGSGGGQSGRASRATVAATPAPGGGAPEAPPPMQLNQRELAGQDLLRRFEGRFTNLYNLL